MTEQSTDSLADGFLGYRSLVERARELQGDLCRIIGVKPPPQASREWRQGFDLARAELIDLLLPDDVLLADYVTDHWPNDDDLYAVEAFAAGDRTIEEIRDKVLRPADG